MAGKKIGKKLASGYMVQLIKFWRPKPKFHAKNQNSLGGGGGTLVSPPPLPFLNRDFSQQNLKRKANAIYSSSKKFGYYISHIWGYF